MRRPSSKELNALYAAYCADESRKDELLTAVLARAAWVLRDDDLAQDFIIGVWQAIPVDFTPFSQWVRNRLALYKLRSYHAIATAKEESKQEDELERLSEASRRVTLPISAISDPFVRKVADYLLQGYTQQEIAEALLISPDCLRKRLQRLRDK